MRISKLNLRSTFFSLLGYGSVQPGTPPPQDLESLRQAMLTALEEAGCESHDTVTRRLRLADDVHALWYARSEVMAALATGYGEARARREMDVLTARFRPLLPRSMDTGSDRAPR